VLKVGPVVTCGLESKRPELGCDVVGGQFVASRTGSPTKVTRMRVPSAQSPGLANDILDSDFDIKSIGSLWYSYS